tara:strand:+ start:681 stop:1070 length:390 start_codon:yes stop_codon:yes gene_type:complete
MNIGPDRVQPGREELLAEHARLTERVEPAVDRLELLSEVLGRQQPAVVLAGLGALDRVGVDPEQLLPRLRIDDKVELELGRRVHAIVGRAEHELATAESRCSRAMLCSSFASGAPIRPCSPPKKVLSVP